MPSREMRHECPPPALELETPHSGPRIHPPIVERKESDDPDGYDDNGFPKAATPPKPEDLEDFLEGRKIFHEIMANHRPTDEDCLRRTPAREEALSAFMTDDARVAFLRDTALQVAPAALRKFEFGGADRYDKRPDAMKVGSLDIVKWAVSANIRDVDSFIQGWRNNDPDRMVQMAEPLADHLCDRLGDTWYMDLGKMQIPPASGADTLERWMVATSPEFKAQWQAGNRFELIQKLTNQELGDSCRSVSLGTAEMMAQHAIEEHDFAEVTHTDFGDLLAKIPERYGKTREKLQEDLAEYIYGEADSRRQADLDNRRNAREMDSERIYDEATLNPDKPAWRE